MGGKEKKNAMAEMFNWEQRIITEMEAPHKWNEAWASFYAKDVPVEYAEKIEFLERQMKNYPDPKISIPSGHGFANIGDNFRRKKMFGVDTDFSDVKDD